MLLNISDFRHDNGNTDFEKLSDEAFERFCWKIFKEY